MPGISYWGVKVLNKCSKDKENSGKVQHCEQKGALTSQKLDKLSIKINNVNKQI